MKKHDEREVYKESDPVLSERSSLPPLTRRERKALKPGENFLNSYMNDDEYAPKAADRFADRIKNEKRTGTRIFSEEISSRSIQQESSEHRTQRGGTHSRDIWIPLLLALIVFLLIIIFSLL